MDTVSIKGLFLTPLKIIYHPNGNIFHGIKRSDNGFSGFGEAYFSTIKGGQIKGWKRHTRMTLNLVVPLGKVIFVIYDDRENNNAIGKFFKIELSPDSLCPAFFVNDLIAEAA